jgi:hypothetical protein
MIAALYVETNGVYFGLPDVEPWDIRRDARSYAGPWPVVAHPPCAAWSQLASVREWRYGLMRGEDDGLFARALEQVREHGGVLEHPAQSGAWARFALTPAAHGRWNGSLYKPDEWATEVHQRNYGHRAHKRTWLLYVGAKPPALDWAEPAAWESRVEYMCRKERLRTPVAFRDLLISIARSAAEVKIDAWRTRCVMSNENLTLESV